LEEDVQELDLEAGKEKLKRIEDHERQEGEKESVQSRMVNMYIVSP